MFKFLICFFKTSYRLLILPTPTNLLRQRFILGRIKLTARVECGASIHAIFQLTVRRIQMFFSLKPSQSKGESSLKISDRCGSPFRGGELGNIQTHRLTHSLTDWYFDRVIKNPHLINPTLQISFPNMYTLL